MPHPGDSSRLRSRYFLEMGLWRLFYWVRLFAVLFAIFIVATASLDISLAPESNAADVTPLDTPATPSELPEFERVLHEGGTDKVGGWLSVKIDDGLGRLEGLRLEVRDIGSRIGGAVGL